MPPCSTSLYARWREVAAASGQAPALTIAGTQSHISFLELQQLAHAQPTVACHVPAFPSGRGVSFFVETLAAWRDGRVLCPLDASQPNAMPPPGYLAERSISHIKLTSGSTGAPRLILLTAEQLAADAQHIMATMGLRTVWPNVAAISLAHSYGFSNIVLPLLLHGVPVVLVDQPFPAAVEQALRSTATTPTHYTLPAVPALWKAWHAAGILSAPNIALAISAGAPLPLALEKAIYDDYRLKVHNFYGSSECGAIAYDATTTPREDESQIGQPMHGVKVRLCQETGRIIVHSPAVATTAWPAEDPEITPNTFRLADLGQICPNTHNVRLLGRVGEVMNLAGRKLHPSAVETVLTSIPGVREAIVFSIPSPATARGEEMVALVHLTDAAQLHTTRQAAAKLLPAWQMPKHWKIEPKLAPDHRGKLSRERWKQEFLSSRSQMNGSTD